MKDAFLSVMLAIFGRGLIVRDRLTGVVKNARKPEPREEFYLESGERKLAAVFVPGSPTVLICHGIGETVEHWSRVQAWLQDRGVGSMVFNYSGYGRSTGKVCAKHCDEDLVVAFEELRRRVEGPVYVLGYSLGGGIAAAGNLEVEGLFLCETFTSFREAARRVGCAQWLTELVPDVWTTEKNLVGVRVPVYVVHSDGDELFPVEMARRNAEACGGELVVVEGFAHNEPMLTAADAYWERVVERMR